jgi:indole-3-glycerol phosphate synthase
VHDPNELEYLKAGVPDMLGVNNRCLGTFHTDVQHSFDIAEAMRAAIANLGAQAPVLVSESGISSPETVKRLRQVGFRGFLIGECFMREADPGQALANFVEAIGS